MFNWAKQTLANVAGTQEPIYGPQAIKSVAEEAQTVPYTESTRDDMKWLAMDSTCVETQVFYFMADSGALGMAQVIYSNVMGVRTTCQFVSKIFYKDGSKPHLWCSNQLNNHDFSEDKTGFYADDVAVELSEDGKTYTIKSMTDSRSIVNLKVTRTAPGFQAGKTGKTLYGTDLNDPWGSMRHCFWPRCVAEGTITTPDGPVDFKGRAMAIHALQGMKPHHAAARWNFVDFQGPNHSAVMMEFTTPPSYGSTVVNVSAIAKDDEIVIAGCKGHAKHTKTKEDTDNDWPEPTEAEWVWSGSCKHEKPVEAVLHADLSQRLDRMDVMAEVPGFVKKIVGGVAGTKPYIYQVTLKLKIGDHEINEEGDLFTEATFISDISAPAQ